MVVINDIYFPSTCHFPSSCAFCYSTDFIFFTVAMEMLAVGCCIHTRPHVQCDETRNTRQYNFTHNSQLVVHMVLKGNSLKELPNIPHSSKHFNSLSPFTCLLITRTPFSVSTHTMAATSC